MRIPLVRGNKLTRQHWAVLLGVDALEHAGHPADRQMVIEVCRRAYPEDNNHSAECLGENLMFALLDLSYFGLVNDTPFGRHITPEGHRWIRQYADAEACTTVQEACNKVMNNPGGD